jgi:hypothetical protein
MHMCGRTIAGHFDALIRHRVVNSSTRVLPIVNATVSFARNHNTYISGYVMPAFIMCMVSYLGFWIDPAAQSSFEISCPMNTERLPFDVQKCELRIGLFSQTPRARMSSCRGRTIRTRWLTGM